MLNCGGESTIGLEQTYVGIESTTPDPDMNQGPYLRLTVSDTGHGMSPRVMERIFEPYFTTKRHRREPGWDLPSYTESLQATKAAYS